MSQTQQEDEMRDDILAELGEPSPVCALCETILDEEEPFENHDCILPYKKYVQDKNFYIYPVYDDGTLLRKSLMPNGKEEIVKYNFTLENNGEREDIDDDDLLITTKDATYSEMLIQSVYERRGLWDIKLPVIRRSRSKKDALWQEISDCFADKPSIKDLKHKWKSLCTTYNRVRKEMADKSGQAAEKKTKWQYFDMMNFLDRVDLNNQSTASNVQDSTNLTHTMPLDESIAGLSNFQNVPELDELLEEDGNFENAKNHNISSNRKQNKNANVQLLAAEKLANAIQASSPVINFPNMPAFPVPPPPTEASAFAHLMEVRLNTIQNIRNRQEVMDNMYQFLSHEIRRLENNEEL